MENVRRYRALASLCRQQAAYRPLQNWQLLGQAEHFEYLAEIALKAHFDACNTQLQDDTVATAAMGDVRGGVMAAVCAFANATSASGWSWRPAWRG